MACFQMTHYVKLRYKALSIFNLFNDLCSYICPLQNFVFVLSDLFLSFFNPESQLQLNLSLN